MKKTKRRKKTSRDLAILGHVWTFEWNRGGVAVLEGARREAGGAPMLKGKLVASPAMAPGSSGAGREWGFVERRRRRGKRGKKRNPRVRPGAAL